MSPENELIGLEVKLRSGGASVNWWRRQRGAIIGQCVGLLWETFAILSLLTRVFLPWVPKSSSSCCVGCPWKWLSQAHRPTSLGPIYLLQVASLAIPKISFRIIVV